MHHAVADKFRVFKTGYHGKYPLLLAEFQMGLEAHQIVHALGRVVLPQLHHGVRLMAGGGISQPHRLHGAVAQGIHAPPRHDFHGHTALKNVFILKAMHRGFLGIC